jgi:hypothetical protein
MMAAQAEEDEEEGSAAAGFVKGLGVIILALILGAGAAYGFYVVSTPRLNATPYQLPTQTTSPAVSPSPSSTKTGLLQPPSSGPTLRIG